MPQGHTNTVQCRHGRDKCFGKFPEWKKYNKQELKNITEELMKSGKHPFLSGGTLLGYARQGDLLDNDDDLDITLFQHEYDDTAESIISTLGFDKVVHTTKEGIQLTLHKTETEPHEDVEIDVPIMEANEKEFRQFSKFTENGEFNVFTPFDLKLIEFWGMTVYIPAQYDLYLREMYGNWENPDPWFDWRKAPNVSVIH